ncbi:hypothetical protein D3C80_1010460 [compost metagenome]
MLLWLGALSVAVTARYVNAGFFLEPIVDRFPPSINHVTEWQIVQGVRDGVILQRGVFLLERLNDKLLQRHQRGNKASWPHNRPAKPLKQ